VNGERCLRGGCRLNPDVKVKVVLRAIFRMIDESQCNVKMTVARDF
jgi:hypothetical protein